MPAMGRLSSLGSRGLIAGTAKGIIKDFSARNQTLGMTPMQLELNRRWSWYRNENYKIRKYDWDGKEAMEALDMEAISAGQQIAPGFYDASGATMPVKFRRPAASARLPKVIVDRFTGMLFAENLHPQIRVEGDPDTEDFVHALAESSRLWAQMAEARAYGGAQGTVCIGFQILEGVPVIDIHDARWTHPEFESRATLKLKSIEKKYMYPVEEMNQETGMFESVPYWYRRVIDASTDTVWEKVPVGDGVEPDWDNLEALQVAHNLGFCPCVWVQNLPCQDEIYGIEDCDGIYENCERADMQLSQADRSAIHNGDPTLHVGSDDEMDTSLQKGSGHAIKTEKGGTVAYVEIAGEGPKLCMEVFRTEKAEALEIAQCVLESPTDTTKTATEIERTYSSMLSKIGRLREQYGERCVKPVMKMLIKAAQKLGRGLVLPPKVMPAQSKDGEIQYVERKLGPARSEMKLQWPKVFEPTPSESLQVVQTANFAKAGKLIDQEHAVKHVAEIFRVEDVKGLMDRVEKESKDAQDDMDARLMSGMDRKADSIGRMPDAKVSSGSGGPGGGGGKGGGMGAGLKALL